ncbi:hypothetical protein D918_05449 [Trichuris suis]|nr:hypothetical protein D918_05449 [Trichuris suis]
MKQKTLPVRSAVSVGFPVCYFVTTLKGIHVLMENERPNVHHQPKATIRHLRSDRKAFLSRASRLYQILRRIEMQDDCQQRAKGVLKLTFGKARRKATRKKMRVNTEQAFSLSSFSDRYQMEFAKLVYTHLHLRQNWYSLLCVRRFKIGTPQTVCVADCLHKKK